MVGELVAANPCGREAGPAGKRAAAIRVVGGFARRMDPGGGEIGGYGLVTGEFLRPAAGGLGGHDPGDWWVLSGGGFGWSAAPVTIRGTGECGER